MTQEHHDHHDHHGDDCAACRRLADVWESTIAAGPRQHAKPPAAAPPNRRKARAAPPKRKDGIGTLRCGNPACGKLALQKYEYCWDCRLAQGDLILCESCGERYHNRKYDRCWPCAQDARAAA